MRPISIARTGSVILPIKFSVRERDLGSAIQEAQDKVAALVQLPPGSRTEWVGEFGNLQDAIARLSIVVPISLALIGVLLWFNFGSMADTLLAMSVIPMAIFGGVLGLLITVFRSAHRRRSASSRCSALLSWTAS